MKKLLMLLSLCAFMATACESTTTTPQISIKESNIQVGSLAGKYFISYTIENRVNNLAIEVASDVEWAHSFTDEGNGDISFFTFSNELYEERTGVITLTYGNTSASVQITQEAKKVEEKTIEAPYLIGEYYGDYAGINYNYYVAFSSSDYDNSKPLYSPGWKYFLDVYATEAPEDINHIHIPNGVYTLTTAGGKDNSIFHKFSLYKEYEAANDSEGYTEVAWDLPQ